MERSGSTNISGETALARLQKKYGSTQTGGKGTVRRKRVPAKKKRVDGVSGKNLELTTKLVAVVKAIGERVDDLSNADSQKSGDYLEPIHQEFLSAFSKADRKNNKVDHHQKIRQSFVEYLSLAPKIHQDLIAYSVKNLNAEALERLIHLLEIYVNVLKNKEYQRYTKPASDYSDTISDQKIAASYQTLELKPEEKLDPVSLRHYYLERRERLFLQNNTKETTTEDKDTESPEPVPLSVRLDSLDDAYLTIYSLLACHSL